MHIQIFWPAANNFSNLEVVHDCGDCRRAGCDLVGFPVKTSSLLFCFEARPIHWPSSRMPLLGWSPHLVHDHVDPVLCIWDFPFQKNDAGRQRLRFLVLETRSVVVVVQKTTFGNQNSSLLVAKLSTVARNQCGAENDVSFYCCFVACEGAHALGCGWLHRFLGCTATLPDGSDTGIYLWFQTGGDFGHRAWLMRIIRWGLTPLTKLSLESPEGKSLILGRHSQWMPVNHWRRAGWSAWCVALCGHRMGTHGSPALGGQALRALRVPWFSHQNGCSGCWKHIRGLDPSPLLRIFQVPLHVLRETSGFRELWFFSRCRLIVGGFNLSNMGVS